MILDTEIKFMTSLMPPVLIDSLATLGIGRVNGASVKATSLLRSGILFPRRFNLVSIMNQSDGKTPKNHMKTNCSYRIY